MKKRINFITFLFFSFCLFLSVITFSLSFFPHSSKQPKNLDVVVVGETYEERVLITTLQGIINRKEPRIYLIETKQDPASFILSLYQQEYDVKINDATLEKILRKYKGEINGYIVYDANDKFTVNIATTLSGLTDAVCVTENLRPLVERVGLKEKENLIGKYPNKYVAYRDTFKKYFLQCNKKVLGILAPNTWKLRDYLVQNKVFTFYALPITKERTLLEEILSKTPDNIPVFGYLSRTGAEEFLAVSLLSKNNKILIPSDIQSNLSVHSGFSFEEKKFKTRAKERNLSHKDINRKLGVVLSLTDGDNVYVPLTYFLQQNYWRSSQRGKIPIGWSISPALLDIAPAVASYYKETATENDELIAMISVGYTHPTYYKDINFLSEKTLDFVKAFNLTTLWTIDPTIYNPLSSLSLKMFSHFAKPPLRGFLVGYSPPLQPDRYYLTKEKFPLLFCRTNYQDRLLQLHSYIEKELSTLKDGETRIVFYGLSNWGFNIDEIYAGLKDLLSNKKIIFLKPSEAFNYLHEN